MRDFEDEFFDFDPFFIDAQTLKRFEQGELERTETEPIEEADAS